MAHRLLSATPQLSQATCLEISAAEPRPRAQPGCPGSPPTGTARWINMGFGLDKAQALSPHPTVLLASTSSKQEQEHPTGSARHLRQQNTTGSMQTRMA